MKNRIKYCILVLGLMWINYPQTAYSLGVAPILLNQVNNFKSSEMKKCTKCNVIKPLSEFYKKKEKKDRLASWCKACDSKRKQKYFRTVSGLITQIYGTQRASSKDRNHQPPNYTKQELKNWILSQPNFQELWDNWVASGYKKALTPSCDRTDDYKGYCLTRLQLGTWKENQDKAGFDRRNGINNKVSKAIIGTYIKTGDTVGFCSMKQAERSLGVHAQSISAVCLGKRKTAGGYVWKFKNKT